VQELSDALEAQSSELASVATQAAAAQQSLRQQMAEQATASAAQIEALQAAVTSAEQRLTVLQQEQEQTLHEAQVLAYIWMLHALRS
jgi:hypothetical protein